MGKRPQRPVRKPRSVLAEPPGWSVPNVPLWIWRNAACRTDLIEEWAVYSLALGITPFGWRRVQRKQASLKDLGLLEASEGIVQPEPGVLKLVEERA